MMREQGSELKYMTSHKQEISYLTRAAGGVAGAERLVGECKFHSLGKCTMVLTNMHLDFMYIASSGLCISCMNVHACII